MTPVYPINHQYPANGMPPPGGYMPPQAEYAIQQGYPQGYAAPPGYAAAPGTLPIQPYGVPPQAQSVYNPGEAPPGYAGYPPQQQQQLPLGYGYPPNTSYPAMDPSKPADGAPLPYAQPYGQAVVAIPVAAPPENPRNVIERGRWSAGLCDCCSSCVPNCCMAWCCPCISLAQIQARIGMAPYLVALIRLLALIAMMVVFRFVFGFVSGSGTGEWVIETDDSGYSYYRYIASDQEVIMSIVGYTIWSMLQLVFTAAVCVTRGRVRQRFSIPGGCCGDCWSSWCCSCCAIAQMATHVKSYKPGSCDFTGPDVLPAFN